MGSTHLFPFALYPFLFQEYFTVLSDCVSYKITQTLQDTALQDRTREEGKSSRGRGEGELWSWFRFKFKFKFKFKVRVKVKGKG